jgi:hypothetical protein
MGGDGWGWVGKEGKDGERLRERVRKEREEA